jgi:hypothetical protein
MNEDKREQHPTYGFIQVSRVSGGSGTHFLSGVKTHSSIRVTIGRAEKWTSASEEERMFANEQLVEVSLTPSQFADMITNLNNGMGTPCTIRYVGREHQGEVPTQTTLMERQKEAFKERISAFAETLKAQKQSVRDLLEKKSLNKEDRKALSNILERSILEVESNLPFMLVMFHEAAEKATSRAKQEIEAYAAHVLKADRSVLPADPILMLEEKNRS